MISVLKCLETRACSRGNLETTPEEILLRKYCVLCRNRSGIGGQEREPHGLLAYVFNRADLDHPSWGAHTVKMVKMRGEVRGSGRIGAGADVVVGCLASGSFYDITE